MDALTLILLTVIIFLLLNIVYLKYCIKKTKEENLNVFREKLTVNQKAMLQEWNDTMDKYILIPVTIISIKKYAVKVVDNNLEYHVCNHEDLFPSKYYVE